MQYQSGPVEFMVRFDENICDPFEIISRTSGVAFGSGRLRHMVVFFSVDVVVLFSPWFLRCWRQSSRHSSSYLPDQRPRYLDVEQLKKIQTGTDRQWRLCGMSIWEKRSNVGWISVAVVFRFSR